MHAYFTNFLVIFINYNFLHLAIYSLISIDQYQLYIDKNEVGNTLMHSNHTQLCGLASVRLQLAIPPV